jgi:hypothetical protein
MSGCVSEELGQTTNVETEFHPWIRIQPDAVTTVFWCLDHRDPVRLRMKVFLCDEAVAEVEFDLAASRELAEFIVSGIGDDGFAECAEILAGDGR